MFVLSLSLILVAIVSGQQERESCVDATTKAVGRCKALNQCETFKQDFLTSGKKPTLCSSSILGQVLICCREASNITTAENPSGIENRPSGQQDGKRVSERKCEEYSKGVVQEVENIPLIPESNTLPTESVKCDYDLVPFFGGDNAEPGEYPHMAAIGWVDFNDKYIFSCGGSLISPRFVLTSGQCTWKLHSKDHAPAIVRLGDQNLDDSVDDGANPIEIPIRHIHKHPDYKSPKLDNNIGLLELATDVAFTAHIRPACLWTKPNFPGYTIAVSSGWGESYTVNNETTKQLKKVVLSLLENEICKPLLLSFTHYQFLMDTQVCAGKLWAQDACQGDPGSPLQVTSKDRCIFHLIGVTSRGRSCTHIQRPSVYTRVSSYLDWIEKIVWHDE